MTAAKLKSDFKLTTDTPYLALAGELWGVYHKDLGENEPRYNDSALYHSLCHDHYVSMLYSTGPTHAKLVSLTSPCCSG